MIPELSRLLVNMLGQILNCKTKDCGKKDGLTYVDFDYQANMNLVQPAINQAVSILSTKEKHLR